MKFTVFGSKGFIGSNLVTYLENNGHECFTPDIRVDDVSSQSLGHVIYTIGVPDFKNRIFDSIEAHVCLLQNLLKNNNFDSFLYLSGTRLYQHNQSTKETDPIIVHPFEINDLYNISKALGDCLCLSINNPKIRTVRLSNVSGNNFNSTLFLPSIIRDSILKKKIVLNSSLKSEKDYIHIDDVVKLLSQISLRGHSRIYNIASGKNTTNKEIISKLSEITQCKVKVMDNAPLYSFPTISIEQITTEFDFKPTSVVDTIEDMITNFRNYLRN